MTHMEHHSNQTSWLETLGEVILVNPDREGTVLEEGKLCIISDVSLCFLCNNYFVEM